MSRPANRVLTTAIVAVGGALLASSACSQTNDAQKEAATPAPAKPVEARADPPAPPPAGTPMVPPTPPAPHMPEGWQVTSDIAFPVPEVARISKNLGGTLSALRNTVYQVEGQSVKINLMVAADEDAAAVILTKLQEMKPEDFSWRQGLTIYELVGKDSAVPQMRAARAHVESK